MSFLRELFGGGSAATPGWNPNVDQGPLPAPAPVNYNPAIGAIGVGLSQLAAGQAANIMPEFRRATEYQYQQDERERKRKELEALAAEQDAYADKVEKSGNEAAGEELRQTAEELRQQATEQEIPAMPTLQSYTAANDPENVQAAKQLQAIQAASGQRPVPAMSPLTTRQQGQQELEAAAADLREQATQQPIPAMPVLGQGPSVRSEQGAAAAPGMPGPGAGMAATIPPGYRPQTPAERQAAHAAVMAANPAMNPLRNVPAMTGPQPGMAASGPTAPPVQGPPPGAPRPASAPGVSPIQNIIEDAYNNQIINAAAGETVEDKEVEQVENTAAQQTAAEPDRKFGAHGIRGETSRKTARRVMAKWGVPRAWQRAVMNAAEKYEIPTSILVGMFTQESGWDPTIESKAGAVGLAQLMPATAKELGVRDRTDPIASIEAGARYLKQRYNAHGNWNDALMAYNAGDRGLREMKSGKRTFAKETREYVPKIMGRLGIEPEQPEQTAAAPGPVTGTVFADEGEEEGTEATLDDLSGGEGNEAVTTTVTAEDDGGEQTTADTSGTATEPEQEAQAQASAADPETPVEQAAAQQQQTYRRNPWLERREGESSLAYMQRTSPDAETRGMAPRLSPENMEKAVARGQAVSKDMAAKLMGSPFSATDVRMARMLGPEKGTAYLAKMWAENNNQPYKTMKDGQGNIIAYNSRNPADNYMIGSAAKGTLSALGKEMTDRGLNPENPNHVARVLSEKALMKRAGATNVNIDTHGNNLPPPEKGFTYRVYPPGHQHEGKVWRDPETGQAEQLPIKGSLGAQKLADAKSDAAAAAATADVRAQQKEQTRYIVNKDIGRAINMINDPQGPLGLDFIPSTEIFGWITQAVPGMPAYDLKEALGTIKANIGFNKLAEMRAASPTGGALGQVSNFENELLQATQGSLDQFQTKEELIYNLQRIQVMQNLVATGGINEKTLKVRQGAYAGMDFQQAMDQAMADANVQLPPSMRGLTQQEVDSMKGMSEDDLRRIAGE